MECVREGCQSETLRQMIGSVPEGRCLTVVFKGPRKSLDLLCQSQKEAQHWVRGIQTLQERVDNMTQKEKLDQYPFLTLSLLSVKNKSKINCYVWKIFSWQPKQGHLRGLSMCQHMKNMFAELFEKQNTRKNNKEQFYDLSSTYSFTLVTLW